MSKATVIFTATTVAFVLIISIQTINTCSNDWRLRQVHSLNRRLGFNARSIPFFDPLIAKEKREELDEEEKEYYDEGSLRTSLRLMALFPFLDKSPKDGFIDLKELEAWIRLRTIDGLNYRAKTEMDSRDKNGDNAISFFEYFPQFKDEVIESSDTTHGGAAWWMEQFKNADVDSSGTLNLYEFRDFLHPEDSNNENIRRRLLRDKIRQMDRDNDQKINFLEFEAGAYDSYKAYVEFEDGGHNLPSPRHLFEKLDSDADGFLGVQELRPIIQYLNPGELIYAKYYSKYLMREVAFKFNDLTFHTNGIISGGGGGTTSFLSLFGSCSGGEGGATSFLALIGSCFGGGRTTSFSTIWN